VVVFLKRKVPQLNPNMSKEDQQQMANRMASQMSLMPDTLQTILKCISGSPTLVNAEIQQEIYQMNVQARLLMDKQAQQPASNILNLQTVTGQQQPAAAAAAIKSLVGAGGASGTPGTPGTAGTPHQATIDMIQSMINLNMNPTAAANQFANSPSKILLSQLNPSLNLQTSSLQSALPSKFINILFTE
jgi:hypothetical protein